MTKQTTNNNRWPKILCNNEETIEFVVRGGVSTSAGRNACFLINMIMRANLWITK